MDEGRRNLRPVHPVFFVCALCGTVVSPLPPSPYRCPRAPADPGVDAGHLLLREIEPARLSWPDLGPPISWLRFRGLLSIYHRFRAAGGSDGEFVGQVEALDERLSISGRGGLVPPPVRRAEALELASGRDERGEVWFRPQTERPRAALLALLLPTWLELEDPVVLVHPGSEDEVEARALADCLGVPVSGGPVEGAGIEPVLLTRANVSHALTHEAGGLAAWEVAFRLREAGRAPDRVFLPPDRAAARAAAVAFREAYLLGALPSLPRLHWVESEKDPTVSERYEATLEPILREIDPALVEPPLREAARRFPRVRGQIAGSLAAGLRAEPGSAVRRAIEKGLQELRERIGPDLPLIRTMIESGGFPITVPRSTWSRVVPEPLPAALAEDGPEIADRALAAAGLLSLAESEDLPASEVLVVLEG